MGGDLTHDQAALVLRRAAELDQRFALPDEPGIDQEALEEAAVEAGLSPAAVHRALAEFKSGMLDEPPRRHLVLGGPALTVCRTLPGSQERVRRQLHSFLRDQVFEMRRDRGSTTTWVRRRGLPASTLRAVDLAISRRIVLRNVHRVELTLTAQGPDAVLVRLVADVAAIRHRQATIAGSTAATGAGMALTTAAVAPRGVILVATATGAGLAGLGHWAGRRLYRDRVGEIDSALNGLFDRLEAASPTRERAAG